MTKVLVDETIKQFFCLNFYAMDIYDVAQDATQIATATNKSDYWYIYPVGINRS